MKILNNTTEPITLEPGRSLGVSTTQHVGAGERVYMTVIESVHPEESA